MSNYERHHMSTYERYYKAQREFVLGIYRSIVNDNPGISLNELFKVAASTTTDSFSVGETDFERNFVLKRPDNSGLGLDSRTRLYPIGYREHVHEVDDG